MSEEKKAKLFDWSEEESQKVFSYIDEHKEEYIQRLAEAVAIDSVSGEVERRPKVIEMGHWVKNWIEKLGGSVEMRDLGKHTMNGSELDLPPVVFGTYGTDKQKKTLCVYGHYDVQPAELSDGWDTEPFVLTEKDGKLYGRGSSDDKGPVLGWLWVIEAAKELGIDIPVNIKMVFEGMEESGSIGLDKLIMDEKNGFLADVDCVCISDNYWLGTTKPCVTYGLRGICYFFAEVECAAKDLHSGVFGGTTHEAMIDLVKVFDSLVDQQGNILIPGVNETVAAVTEDEKELYKPIEFTNEDYMKDNGLLGTMHDTKEGTLMHRWRFPSLSIHGIEGAFYSEGAKTVIPRKVIGKFSIRLVPDQTPDDIYAKVKKHCEEVHASLGTKTKFRLWSEHGGKPWVADTDHPNFVAGIKATEQVYGVTPDMTREGGSIPITLIFEEATEKSVMLLPMGRGDDGAHSQNEKLDVSNYINGIKLLASYIFHLKNF